MPRTRCPANQSLLTLASQKQNEQKKKTFFTDSYAGYCCVPQLPYPANLESARFSCMSSVCIRLYSLLSHFYYITLALVIN